MKITIHLLKELDACKGGIDFYIENNEPQTLHECMNIALDKNKFGYINWLLVMLMNRKQRLVYACYAVRQILHLYENIFPNDFSIRQAIEVVEKCIVEDTEENRKKAIDVINAIRDVVRDPAYAIAFDIYIAIHAFHAAYNAIAAATDAANAAAHAAVVIVYAVRDSAYAAHIPIHVVNIERDLLEHGIKLIEGV